MMAGMPSEPGALRIEVALIADVTSLTETATLDDEMSGGEDTEVVSVDDGHEGTNVCATSCKNSAGVRNLLGSCCGVRIGSVGIAGRQR